MTKSKITWNVYYGDWNERLIKFDNIFDHYGFYKDCRKNVKENYEDRAKFEEVLRQDLFYYYCSKCEWEIVLSGWPSGDRIEGKKIDVYSQIMINWNIFADYVWENRRKIYRKRIKNEQ